MAHAGNHEHSEPMPPRVRFNSGYWDGRHAREHPGLRQMKGIDDALRGVHFDKTYGLGVQAGYNEPDPAVTSSDKAWNERRRRTDAPWISRRT